LTPKPLLAHLNAHSASVAQDIPPELVNTHFPDSSHFGVNAPQSALVEHASPSPETEHVPPILHLLTEVPRPHSTSREQISPFPSVEHWPVLKSQYFWPVAGWQSELDEQELPCPPPTSSLIQAFPALNP